MLGGFAMGESSARQWSVLVGAHRTYCDELAQFGRMWDEDSEQIVRDGLQLDLRVALAVIRMLPLERAVRLLPDLLNYARSVHGYLEDVRETILSIPKDRLVLEIEGAAGPLLSAGDDEDYRRLLELYLRIDHRLALRLATTAAGASDPNVREIGEEFLRRLG